MTNDAEWMQRALHYADVAQAAGDVPIGCVIVHNDMEIAHGYNTRERAQDPTGHAEMMAIRQASEALKSWRLIGTTVYVTLEPCAMCAGALVHARVDRLVYGCADRKAGAVQSLFNIGVDPRLNHRFALTQGVLGIECSDKLSRFFSGLRVKKS